METRGLTKTFERQHFQIQAVQDVDLRLEEGTATALIGPSGCGKSTLLNLLGLMTRPTSGDILIQGTPLASAWSQRARLRNQFFGYIHQSFSVIEDETVERNVMIPLEYASPRVGRRERRSRTRSAVAKVGMEWSLQVKTRELSGGERQRVAIARSIVNDPLVILADEPTASLDSTTSADVVNDLLAIRSRGAAILIATHDPRVAGRCDRILTMHDGGLQAQPT
jgi:putative ABC transport system ATP-binding protein